MARAVKVTDSLAWPAGLDVCQISDWINDEDRTKAASQYVEPLSPHSLSRQACIAQDLGFTAWQRWTDARFEYLVSLGVNRDDAQFESCGPMPSVKEISR